MVTVNTSINLNINALPQVLSATNVDGEIILPTCAIHKLRKHKPGCKTDDDEMLIAAITGITQKDWQAKIIINSHNITFKIGTGTQCNVMSSQDV